MKESTPVSIPHPPESYIPLIRRHVHDVRNGLNGFDIEVAVMDIIHRDEKTKASIRRMRNQGAAIELALRFLVNRFTEPDVQLVPAVDVFNLWQSRCKPLPNYDDILWTQDIGDALVSVDSDMVADALCEAISYVRGTSIHASVTKEGDEVIFEIRPQNVSATLVSVDEWPLMDQIIQKNGGRHEAVTVQAQTISRRYWFPTGKFIMD